jgi:hypothetical protein
MAHLLWAAVVVYAIHRIGEVAMRFAPVRPDAVSSPEDVVVPEDLMAYAMSHSEQWAQEDALRAIQQSYEQWKDWNRVRAAVGIGRMD